MADSNGPFWENKTLTQMTDSEWESLCDGCAKCCLHKLENEEGDIFYTRVVCRYLEQKECRCSVYGSRKQKVPDCIKLEPGCLDGLDWMPSTCAYRLLNEGKPLPEWHPLLSGGRSAMIESGHTVTGKVVSEEFVHEEGLEEHIIKWVE